MDKRVWLDSDDEPTQRVSGADPSKAMPKIDNRRQKLTKGNINAELRQENISTLAAIQDYDRELVKEVMAKMMENIIRGEERRRPRQRQPSRWPKGMRRKSLIYASNTEAEIQNEEQTKSPINASNEMEDHMQEPNFAT